MSVSPSVSRFLSVLETLQALDGRRVPAAEPLLVPSLREAGAALPTHMLVHARWVLERCLTPHSYVPASAQEALLQVFLCERVASDLSVLADRLRSGAQPALPVLVPDQPLPAPGRDPLLPLSLHACLPLASRRRMLASGRPSASPQPPAGPPPFCSPEEDVFCFLFFLPRDPRPRCPGAGGRRPARAQLSRSLRGSP